MLTNNEFRFCFSDRIALFGMWLELKVPIRSLVWANIWTNSLQKYPGLILCHLFMNVYFLYVFKNAIVLYSFRKYVALRLNLTNLMWKLLSLTFIRREFSRNVFEQFCDENNFAVSRQHGFIVWVTPSRDDRFVCRRPLDLHG